MQPTPERAIERVQARASRGRWSVGAPFDKRVKKLVRDWGTQKSPTLIEEMITTALKVARDEMTVADLKLINRSAKEMRSAAKIFAPFRHLRKVAVFGSARSADDSPNYKMATDFACEMVRQGFMLIAGGSDGIMGAVQRGHFTGILCSGEIVQRTAIPKENDELETLDLPRLIFTPIRSRFGRFRQLIDAINSSSTT